ncbi:hypothetical protein AD45P2_00405 [Alteromonas phage vB_AmaP_AD45-P2]|uniref:Uncharacterized protein n=1 Tax=Pseudorhizobium pelagicum TaxID=1509405 RepID=A0A922T5C7_9HYPH|nr:hypothetical protein [Pseudorhizobium pelagicum]YP_008126051.1 hypothetical protein M610_gp101 [Alteromonas phage vB_AmaP_AD45-P1]AGM47014.1 hypothetical protein AD45P3_00380 [Alteromonas phage vB_AmaP_AD45-P3]AGM47130.1 hypothetical protein AD45P4_00375 [Alteromonas phage vB_AmaP_AD45-P4]AGM47252.1 hypothetical protein AD45P2_00405 [Alteromonas phage vB_AmaP_AD45-P2]AGM46898.1 hypothetical protein AD45P1_00400 [Alteromonas phage vB_AmaP_AD45-P1]KEQ05628.1 hypothetical protein GV68_08855 [
MKTFSIKQGIYEKKFFYIEISYLGVPWSKERVIRGCIAGSISEILRFDSVKAACNYIKEKYGTSAVIKPSF